MSGHFCGERTLTGPGSVTLRRYDARVSSISDPAKAGRGDKRKAQELIDTAYAGGQITAAERSLRTQRIAAAQTRGDLAMIVRDIGGAGPADAGTGDRALGSALDPAVLASMQVGASYGGSSTAPPTPASTLTAARVTGFVRKARIIVLVAVIAVVGLCGLSLAVIIPAALHSPDPGSTGRPTGLPSGIPTGLLTTAPDGGATHASLHSASGWTELVAAIKAASGSTSVYDVVAYPDYASVGLDGGKAVERRLYRNGGWQDFSVRTPVIGNLVDVAAIDVNLIERLPGETAQHFGIDEPTGVYLIINAILDDPKISVYVQTDGGSQYRSYTLDGRPLG